MFWDGKNVAVDAFDFNGKQLWNRDLGGFISQHGPATSPIVHEDKVIIAKIEGSTFANMIGGPDQKRIITSLTAEELKFTNPASTTGATLELVWKRAK